MEYLRGYDAWRTAGPPEPSEADERLAEQAWDAYAGKSYYDPQTGDVLELREVEVEDDGEDCYALLHCEITNVGPEKRYMRTVTGSEIEEMQEQGGAA